MTLSSRVSNVLTVTPPVHMVLQRVTINLILLTVTVTRLTTTLLVTLWLL